jgi:predicted phosphodiesterase
MDTRRSGSNDNSPDEYTYRDPLLSLWQSAAHSIGTRIEATRDRAEQLVRGLSAPVHVVHGYAQRTIESGHTAFEALPDFTEAADVGGDCARLAAQFLWAELTFNRRRAEELRGRLKMAVCDLPGWSECVEEYVASKVARETNPYLEDKNVVRRLPGKRIAIVGDWGTGEMPARNLLNAVRQLKPDLLIHLGDVYYAGTYPEMEDNFWKICRDAFGEKFPMFALCGNHDMYSGGKAYYSLIQNLGQDASYFCLANGNWQLLAMDTGNRDNNPLFSGSAMTSIHEAEVQWHRERIMQGRKENKRTILLSHHQLFSPFTSVGRTGFLKKYAYNPNLDSVIGDLLPQVEMWFWGHEHNLAVYEPYMGLQRGRCVGASAIPVFRNQQSYKKASGLETKDAAALPTWNTKTQLASDKIDYYHGFAFLELDAKSANVSYYQVRPTDSTPLHLYDERV